MENSIREVQVHISDALEQWSYIMNDIDANCKGHLLHYSDRDLLNTIYMFNHVVSNIAIHNGSINTKNVEKATEMGKELREWVKKYTGIDTVELTNNVLGVKDC